MPPSPQGRREFRAALEVTPAKKRSPPENTYIGPPLSPLQLSRFSNGRPATISFDLAKARLGQGAFRVLVTEALWSALLDHGGADAAGAAGFATSSTQDGPHRVSNGLLLRADLHILFDQGLVTGAPEHVVEVSPAIKERFENGRDCDALREQPLKVLPARHSDLPSGEYLAWHNERVFVSRGAPTLNEGWLRDEAH